MPTSARSIWVCFAGLLLILEAASPQAETRRIASVDFFGTDGLDVQKIRSMLPVRAGDQISEDQGSDVRDRINRVVDRTTGHPVTDVAFVCCGDHGELSIFVGLGGRNSKAIGFNPVPQGSTCLSKQADALYKDAIAALSQAIQNGRSGEDDSHGYSLSEDPAARAKQMAIHEYAMTHEQALENAVQGCRDSAGREAATGTLGYGRNSTAQIRALVHASRDPDDGVRNNAVRALWVIAMASPKAASEIPAADFVEMLNSGKWTDRNKAGQLLVTLTATRNPKLLKELRTSALPSLIEMAQWNDSSHADAYRVLLGRIAGLDEARIRNLITGQRVDEIIAAAKR